MKALFNNQLIKKIFYWVSGIGIFLVIPYLTILFLKFSFSIRPLAIIIKSFILIFCGGFTLVGLMAIAKFFYESFQNKLKK